MTSLAPLDVGVLRVEREDGPAWIARLFPPARPVEAVHGDARILRYLAEVGFPAEQVATPGAVSVHEGQGLLVTELVAATPPPPDVEIFRALGDLLGRLHALAPPPAVAARPGGAWHHLVPQGGLADEMAAILSLLDEAEPRVPAARRGDYEAVRDQLAAAGSFAGLPHALVHPDFVPPNAMWPGPGPVLVDWTGAGSGPRLPFVGFLLWAAGHGSRDCVAAVVTSYRAHVRLEDEELASLAPAITLRPLVLGAWGFALGRHPLPSIDHKAKAEAIADQARRAFRG